jgi:hypothetical protein
MIKTKRNEEISNVPPFDVAGTHSEKNVRSIFNSKASPLTLPRHFLVAAVRCGGAIFAIAMSTRSLAGVILRVAVYSVEEATTTPFFITTVVRRVDGSPTSGGFVDNLGLAGPGAAGIEVKAAPLTAWFMDAVVAFKNVAVANCWRSSVGLGFLMGGCTAAGRAAVGDTGLRVLLTEDDWGGAEGTGEFRRLDV